MNTISKRYHIYLFLTTFYLFWAIWVFIFRPWVGSFSTNAEVRQVVDEMVRVVLWLGPLVIYLRWVVPQRIPLCFLRIISPINAKWLWAMALLSTVWLESVLFTGTYHFKQEMNLFVQIVLKFTLAPLIEEILFRGFVLRMFEEQFHPFLANILQAFYFAVAHFYWLYLYGFSWDVMHLFAFAMAIGWVFGFMAQKTNSILPGVIHHIVNNILSIHKI